MQNALPDNSELALRLALRGHVEVFAARHAALAAAASGLPRSMAEALSRLRRAVRLHDLDELAEADEALHVAIVGLAAVPGLDAVWRVAWEGLREFHAASLREHWPDLRGLLDGHEYLVEAVASGDPGMAEDAARNHLDAVRYRMDGAGDAGGGPDPLARATAYLAFHLHRPLVLAEVAARISFTSPGNLSRLFRQRHGLGFQQYVQRLRMERAAWLLRGSRLSVRDVALRVGYRDVSRFARHFRRWLHTTPLKYRKAGQPGTC